jgi:predicted secreted protein
MEPKQEEKLTREEAKRIVDEMADLIGDRLKDYKDGDAERYLFKEFLGRRRRSGSHADS